MKYEYKATIKVIKKEEPPGEVKFKCPVCGNSIILVIDRQTEEILEIFADAKDEGDHILKCGSCESILEWSLSKPKNPSRRK